jgi:hypothetical protein
VQIRSLARRFPPAPADRDLARLRARSCSDARPAVRLTSAPPQLRGLGQDLASEAPMMSRDDWLRIKLDFEDKAPTLLLRTTPQTGAADALIGLGGMDHEPSPFADRTLAGFAV